MTIRLRRLWLRRLWWLRRMRRLLHSDADLQPPASYLLPELLVRLRWLWPVEWLRQLRLRLRALL